MATNDELETRLAALEASFSLLAPAAVRTNELGAIEAAADNYQLATTEELSAIWDDINKIKQKLTILLGTSPDAGSLQFVTTSSLSLILRTYDNQRAVLGVDIGSLQDEISEIRRKLSILSMQIDPVIAGTCIMLHGANDIEVNTADTAYTPKKQGRITRNADYFFQKLRLRTELKVTGGGTGYLAMFINGTNVLELSTTSATYEFKRGDWDWTGLSDSTWYQIQYQIKASGGGTVYNRALDMIATKPGAWPE